MVELKIHRSYELVIPYFICKIHMIDGWEGKIEKGKEKRSYKKDYLKILGYN